jgi:hypothetical protein
MTRLRKQAPGFVQLSGSIKVLLLLAASTRIFVDAGEQVGQNQV